jgi:hypothetical protein
MRSAKRVPAVLTCPPFRFPGCTMEALNLKQRKPNIASASCRRQRGSAEFGLNRLLQPHCAPLLGPEHWQVGQALDVEPTWKATLHRGFRQYRGDERERHRHPNRALALLFARGERLMVWAGSMRSSSSQRRASRSALMKPSRAFVRMARTGCCASPTASMIPRRRREDARVQGSVKTRSCPSTTIDSSRTISIRASLTVTRSMAFRTSRSVGGFVRGRRACSPCAFARLPWRELQLRST